jgi:hypothetical protein
MNDTEANTFAIKLFEELKRQLKQSYEEAGISGLCDEGRFEAALAVFDAKNREAIVEGILNAFGA